MCHRPPWPSAGSVRSGLDLARTGVRLRDGMWPGPDTFRKTGPQPAGCGPCFVSLANLLHPPADGRRATADEQVAARVEELDGGVAVEQVVIDLDGLAEPLHAPRQGGNGRIGRRIEQDERLGDRTVTTAFGRSPDAVVG